MIYCYEYGCSCIFGNPQQLLGGKIQSYDQTLGRLRNAGIRASLIKLGFCETFMINESHINEIFEYDYLYEIKE